MFLRRSLYQGICRSRRFATAASSTLRPLTRPRRVLFNIPGSDERKLNKAASLNVDCAVLDLEDGVLLAEKPKARTLVAQMLQEEKVTVAFLRADLEGIKSVVAKLDAILIPKVETRDEVLAIDSFLHKHDPNKRVKILAAVESARGILNLKEICEAPRVDALIVLSTVLSRFASEDYCADVGATRTPSAIEMLFARSAVVTHAAAYQLQSIDMVCIQFKNEEQLIRECIDGFNLGFTGKQAIHPTQIAPIMTHFRPSQEKIDFATKVLKETRVQEKRGKGAFEVDGKMVDMPLILQAKRILHRAGIDPETLQ